MRINLIELQKELRRGGLNSTLLYLDALLRRREISRQQHRVFQNWTVATSSNCSNS